MDNTAKTPCRKCGELNPISNDYCRSCGAVLSVSTLEVKAQPKPVMPPKKQIRLWYIAFLASAIFGLLTLFFGLFVAAGLVLLQRTSRPGIENFRALSSKLPTVSIASAAIFLLAFGLGGFGLSWLKGRSSWAEPILSAGIVLVLISWLGSALSSDVPLITGILSLPAAASVAVGSVLGEMIRGNKGEK